MDVEEYMSPPDDAYPGPGISKFEVELQQPLTGRHASLEKGSEKKLDIWNKILIYLTLYHRRIFLVILMLAYFVDVYFEPPMKRNELTREWGRLKLSAIERAKATYRCLYGNDDACECPDFTVPIPRTEEGWLDAHKSNKKKARVKTYFDRTVYDIVFFGNGLVENLDGASMNKDVPEAAYYRDFFRNEFTFESEESIVDSVALGIEGDMTSNLLWRLDNVEIPPDDPDAPEDLQANVFWLMSGIDDLVHGGCSEDGTILGILNSAIRIQKEHRQSVVVIQGILPFTNRPDGLLETQHVINLTPNIFDSPRHRAELARESQLLWTSIQSINEQLEQFCETHEYFVYFDAGALFLENVISPKHGKTLRIINSYMPDYVHLSVDGWDLLGKEILEEYKRIVWDEDQETEIVSKTKKYGGE